jgi:hypothetical protein
MQLRYDDDFIEAAVFACITRHRHDVPSLQVSRFHREREKLYRAIDPEERNAAFFRLHLTWFREWGLEKPLTEIIRDFPLLPEKLAILALRKARHRNDEGAELYVNEAGERNCIVAVRPERFVQNDSIRDYLRHELMHVNDMVDPHFAYVPALDIPGLNPAQQRVAQERYRLLWDITIDGRLATAGHPPATTREQHAAAFARSYSFWPMQKQVDVFDSLWRNSSPSHLGLIALISDPRGLSSTNGPSPGAACPLCGFPTFDWSDADRLPPGILARIQQEFPFWSTERGLCGRCRETYDAAEHALLSHTVKRPRAALWR